MGLMGMGPEQRLLIVDDELSIVQMLEEFFRMEGYETVCAQTPRRRFMRSTAA